MTARLCVLEFVRTGEPNARRWYWRFFALNGEETGRASQDVKKRTDAIRSAEITTGCYGIRELEELGECGRRDPETGNVGRVKVRWVK